MIKIKTNITSKILEEYNFHKHNDCYKKTYCSHIPYMLIVDEKGVTSIQTLFDIEDFERPEDFFQYHLTEFLEHKLITIKEILEGEKYVND